MTEFATRNMVKQLRPNAKATRVQEYEHTPWWFVFDGDEQLSRTLCGRKAAWELALKKLRQGAKQQDQTP